MNMASLPASLPTPPNSTKTKVEHSFDENSHDHDHDHSSTSDVPLFYHANTERGSSPTDFLFPQRDARHATTSPPNSSSPFHRSESPKRARSEGDDQHDSQPHKAMRYSRSPSPKSLPVPQLPVKHLEPSIKFDNPKTPRPAAKSPMTPLTQSNPARQNQQPSPRYPRLSKSERDLVTGFHKEFSSLPIRDYGLEGWFVQRHNPLTRTWAQPLWDMKTPSPKSTPANNPLGLTPKSQRGLVYSVELPEKDLQSLKKKAVKTPRAPRKRQSSTPTHGGPNAKSEARSTRNPANKPLSSKNYRDYPDYSPKTSALTSLEAIKLARNIPQMSGSKDLSTDPLRNELSEAELIAAQKAGMDCARYLCTKRAVFVGFVKHLRYVAGKYELTAEDMKKGLKSWNKTAAQGCSGIDVNKTSALWAGFWQPMGWFDKDNFTDIIQRAEVYFPRFDKEGNPVPQYDSQGNLMH